MRSPTKTATATLPSAVASPGAAGRYAELTRLVERLHRRYLDVIRVELTKAGREEVNAVQALMLANMAGREVSVRDLIDRGYYLGSNASYNVKKLVEGGYIDQGTSVHDRRYRRLRLTEKGLAVVELVRGVEARHAETIAGDPATEAAIEAAVKTLLGIERVWSDDLGSL